MGDGEGKGRGGVNGRFGFGFIHEEQVEVSRHKIDIEYNV
jgi:hypothetical protein